MVISYAVDILMIMVEFDVSLVKDYIIQQQHQSSGQDDVSVVLVLATIALPISCLKQV